MAKYLLFIESVILVEEARIAAFNRNYSGEVRGNFDAAGSVGRGAVRPDWGKGRRGSV